LGTPLLIVVRYTRRDIKCENLLLNKDYNIKLSDFGFARNNMIRKNGQVKMSQTFCGSYAYASPEILNGKPYQPTMSDVWSIGVVLFAMVFGTLPFDDTTFPKLLKVLILPSSHHHITIHSAMIC
jgi:serine kinase